ncbi:MAG: hypothetical protein KDD60_00395 [Bdellovibrionales bacterium]|nr:hypothetical protein [Bdellovibrionales bacterium]
MDWQAWNELENDSRSAVHHAAIEFLKQQHYETSRFHSPYMTSSSDNPHEWYLFFESNQFGLAAEKFDSRHFLVLKVREVTEHDSFTVDGFLVPVGLSKSP